MDLVSNIFIDSVHNIALFTIDEESELTYKRNYRDGIKWQ